MHFNTGFRKNFSCDTQLLSLFQDLSSNPSQTDLIIMDFSKAFDKVPHRCLQYKLNWYGIRGTTHACIQIFCKWDRRELFLNSGVSRGVFWLPGNPPRPWFFLNWRVYILTCTDLHQPLKFATFGNPPWEQLWIRHCWRDAILLPSCPLRCAPRYCSWPHTIFYIHQRPPRRSQQ